MHCQGLLYGVEGHGELVKWVCGMVLLTVNSGDWLLTWCIGVHKFQGIRVNKFAWWLWRKSLVRVWLSVSRDCFGIWKIGVMPWDLG